MLRRKKKIGFYMQCNTRISAKGTTYKPMHNTAVRQPQKTNIKIIVCTVVVVYSIQME